MSPRALVIQVHLLHDRYHGVGDWPPSPFRLFQALVAGAYGGRWRREPPGEKDAAFRWLEGLPPPHIAAPVHLEGQVTTYFVPNNDADTIGGDPLRTGEIRVAKPLRAVLLPGGTSFHYAWRFDDGEPHALRLCDLVERLQAFGRGIDPAFASADVTSWEEAGHRLRAAGVISRPAPGTGGDGLRCPTIGSLASLNVRYDAMSARFETHTIQARGRAAVSTLFRQPPKARCRLIPYDCSPTRLLFELQPADQSRPFRPVAQSRAVEVATAVRDLTARRLASTNSVSAREVERIVIGRADAPVDPQQRVRIVPLPSVGSPNADRAIRRVLLEIPPNSPLTTADVAWAVSGQVLPELDRTNSETGEVLAQTILVPAEDSGMLRRYGIGSAGSTRWHTVTPAALPIRGGSRAQHRNVRAAGTVAASSSGPMRARPTASAGRDALSGVGRAMRDRGLAGGAIDALRHVGLDTRGVTVRVQREPFHRRGLSAELSAAGRFRGHTLHHVEVIFPRPVAGPIIIGDGRWLGLGIMAPLPEPTDGLYVFAVAPATWRTTEGTTLARALRRAVMARASQHVRNGASLPTFFSGHENDGTPAQATYHQHLFYMADDVDGDGYVDRLAVVAPHRADRSSPLDRRVLAQLARALDGFVRVSAGQLGVVELAQQGTPDDEDGVFGAARCWTSRTWYQPTRHPRRRADTRDWVAQDVIRECLCRGFPRPVVDVTDLIVGPRGGIIARVALTFAVAVTGPLMLGAGSHFGDGVFAHTSHLGNRRPLDTREHRA